MATRTARLFAFFFDLCFCFILFSPSLFLNSDSIVLQLLFWMLVLSYWLFKDGMNGQSIGKRFVSIGTIVEQSRLRCGVLQSCVRNGVLLIAMPVDILFGLRPDKRRLGDLIAGTVVVREENLHHWQ
jgi:uncharacterized RDD family membrane protein YckC